MTSLSSEIDSCEILDTRRLRDVSFWDSLGGSALALGIILGAIALTFSNAIHSVWHYDDVHAVKRNLNIRSLDSVPRFFVDPSRFDEDPSHAMYRPLLLSTYALDWRLWGPSPAGFHFSNVLIHAAMACALFFLLKRWIPWALARLPQKTVVVASLLGSLLFAVHPLNGEAVNYICARTSLLAGLFVVLSLVCYSRENGDRVRAVPLVGALIFAGLALLSREITVVLPLVVIATDIGFSRGGVRRRWVPWLGFVLVTVGFVALHGALMGSSVSLSPDRWLDEGDVHSGGGRSILTHLLTSCQVYFLGGKLFFWPDGLTISHSIPYLRSLGDSRALAGLFGFLAIALLAVLALRRFPLLSLGVIWYIAFLLVTNSVIPLNTMFQEHRAYLSVAGFVIFSGGVLEYFARLMPWTGRGFAVASAAVLSLAVAAIVMLGWRTHERNRIWASEGGPWREALVMDPDNVRALYTLGFYARDEGRYERAVTLLTRCVELWPENDFARLTLAQVLERMGDPKTAEKRFIALKDDNTHSPVPAFHLADFYDRHRRYQDALDGFSEVVEIDPSWVEARLRRGLVLEALSRTQEAITLLESLRDMPPGPRDRDVEPKIEAALAKMRGLSPRLHPNLVVD